MSTKDNLKLLDIDEELRPKITKSLQHLIDACVILDLTLDAASSDVVFFVENTKGERLCIG